MAVVYAVEIELHPGARPTPSGSVRRVGVGVGVCVGVGHGHGHEHEEQQKMEKLKLKLKLKLKQLISMCTVRFEART